MSIYKAIQHKTIQVVQRALLSTIEDDVNFDLVQWKVNEKKRRRRRRKSSFVTFKLNELSNVLRLRTTAFDEFD